MAKRKPTPDHPRHIPRADQAVARYIKRVFPGQQISEEQIREIHRAFAAGAHWGMERFAVIAIQKHGEAHKFDLLETATHSVIDLANSTLRPGEDDFINY